MEWWRYDTRFFSIIWLDLVCRNSVVIAYFLGIPYATEKHLIPENDKQRLFLINEDDTKRYCIGDGYINKADVQPAWAITSNKSQGQEYEYVVVVLPCTIQAIPACFVRNHLHVMISRPKTILVILGSRDVLEALSQRRMNAVLWLVLLFF